MNERVLLTGASSGIGLAVVRYLAERGCRVVGTLRDSAVISEIGPGMDNLSFIQMDVTSQESIRTGTAEAVKLLGGIDVLINNAGISHLGPFEQTDFEEARLILETNYWGMVRVTREITPLMRRAGSGLILSIGSIAGHMGIPFQSYYVASKWALLGFSESLRLELKPFGVRVVVIDPGDFKTNIGQNRRLHPDVAPHYQAFYHRVRRVVENTETAEPPDRIARLVHRIMGLARPKARYPVGRGMTAFSLMLDWAPWCVRDWILSRYYGIRNTMEE